MGLEIDSVKVSRGQARKFRRKFKGFFRTKSERSVEETLRFIEDSGIADERNQHSPQEILSKMIGKDFLYTSSYDAYLMRGMHEDVTCRETYFRLETSQEDNSAIMMKEHSVYRGFTT